MTDDNRLFVFLGDYTQASHWRGDVVSGKPVMKEERLNYILIEHEYMNEVEIPAYHSHGELLIREVRRRGVLCGGEKTPGLKPALVVNATYQGIIGGSWIHYTEPLLREKHEAEEILYRLANSNTVKAELFIQDDANEAFDNDSSYRLVFSKTRHPSEIFHMNTVGGSCWFEVRLNEYLGQLIRVGGREYSIKSRNWFQAYWLNHNDKIPRPKLVLSCDEDAR